MQVPAAYDGCTFENFEPVPDTRNALAVCRQWTKEFRAGTDLHQGLLLRGNPGAGKTHLAVADPARGRLERPRAEADGAVPQRPRAG